MAQPAGADDDGACAGVEDRRRLLDRVVGGEPGVRQRCDVLRVQRRVELDDRPRGGLQQLGEPAVRRDARERVVRAVHVVARAARAAQAAGDERVHDDRVADGDVRHRGADLVDPAGVLVPEDVGQLHAALLGPLALLHVQVGAAQPGAADAHDDVVRPGDLRLGDLLDLERLVVGVQARGVHAATSSAGRARRGGRAAASGTGRRCSRGSGDEPRAAQPARQVVGRRSPRRRRTRARARRGRREAELARAASTQRSASGPAGRSREAECHRRPGPSPPSGARRRRDAWRASSALRRKSVRSSSSAPVSRPGTRRRTRRRPPARR